jgi:predicted NBD/HSP70 family sugar kinase
LAVPTSVSTVFREQPDRPALIELQRDLEALFGSDTELCLENNVNCASVGEQFYGSAQGYSTFAYLQLGVKIGLGIVHETRLLRGATHAAGEPARIPFAWTPEAAPTPGRLEQYLGATALMQRVRRKWPTGSKPPKDTSELFSFAEQGMVPACHMVNDHAEDIGRLLAAVVAILDPGLVILGGGIGQSHLLRTGARETLTKLAWPTEVRATQLGDQATVLGATTLATTRALDRAL